MKKVVTVRKNSIISTASFDILTIKHRQHRTRYQLHCMNVKSGGVHSPISIKLQVLMQVNIDRA